MIWQSRRAWMNPAFELWNLRETIQREVKWSLRNFMFLEKFVIINGINGVAHSSVYFDQCISSLPLLLFPPFDWSARDSSSASFPQRDGLAGSHSCASPVIDLWSCHWPNEHKTSWSQPSALPESTTLTDLDTCMTGTCWCPFDSMLWAQWLENSGNADYEIPSLLHFRQKPKKFPWQQSSVTSP